MPQARRHERVREPVADNRDMRQIAQDNESNTRHMSRMADVQFGVSLVQAAQLGRANRLHEQAIRIEEDSNRKIGLLGKHAAETSRLIGKTLEAQSESNRILNGMSKQADRTHRLLAAQLEGQRLIVDKLEQLRTDQAYQSFAQWRQSDEGRQYLQWAEKAQDTTSRIEDYTRRMQAARQKDEELAVRELVAADPKGIMKEPEQPKTPPKPVMTAVPEPGPRPEEPEARERESVWPGIFPFLGIIAGIILTIYFIRQRTYGYETDLFEVLVGGAISIVLYCAIGFGLGFLIMAALMAVLKNTPANRNARKAREEYESAYADWSERNERYQTALDRYETALAAWDRDYNQGGAYRRLKAEHDDRVLDYTDECMRVAHSMFPPATRWAATNPMDTLRLLNGIIQDAPFNPPMPGRLPSPALPVLANVGSLPVYAPNMRAELALIQSENEGRPVRDAEPGQDADAPYEPITGYAALD